MWLCLFFLITTVTAHLFNLSSIYKVNITETELYPKLAPYDTQFNTDPLKGVPRNTRNYIRDEFSKAYYEPKCGNVKNRPYIQPFFYWPGDTIKLQCKVCEKGQVVDGEMKYWAFVHRSIIYKIDNLYKTIKDKQWMPIDKLESFTNIKIGTPDFHRPGPLRKGRILPKSTVTQRNGHLIIQNSRTAHYGLYRCFTKAQEENLDFIYYLIPYTPLLVDTKRVTRDQCKLISTSDPTRVFDEFHRWRTFPTFVQDKENGICNGECNKKFLDVSKIKDPITKWTTPKIPTQNTTVVTARLNLEVYLKWENWTKCKQMNTQTRIGQCYLRKTNKSRIFDPEQDTMLGTLYYATKIHKLLEKVPQFQEDGIPLFSGILMDTIMPKDQTLQHCSSIPPFEWNSLRMLIKTLLNKGVDTMVKKNVMQLSPCVRKIEYKERKSLTMSHTVFQTRKCNKDN
ncbi:unnamed protein product [Bursaphelenchus okinawaensis]|uniref:Uncharacterized protein n=1 Tax=Bursaphelenchus okinawaensis TaxID=465554 RepID=A0A811LM61_9BILA|nr:unnamed protein product [Bursaphelenchus okinawaensis]CAG9126982.1 unnamed protein product [Bursaphelenchus okinawaensis]